MQAIAVVHNSGKSNGNVIATGQEGAEPPVSENEPASPADEPTTPVVVDSDDDDDIPKSLEEYFNKMDKLRTSIYRWESQF